jgi:exodeoxyribonuclease V gamma subunit
VLIARVPMLAAEPELRRERALALLAELVSLRASGLREPLPLPCMTAAAYAREIAEGASLERAQAAAQEQWRSAPGSAREDAEPEHRLAFGEALPFAALLEMEGSRFSRLARRLWDPLLARERIEAA